MDNNLQLSLPQAMSTSPTAQQPFRFLDLPQELQDMIYDKVWKEDGHMTLTPNSMYSGGEDSSDHGQSCLTCDYGPNSGTYGPSSGAYDIGLPRWLLANKSMYHNGLKQLLTKANWTRYPHRQLMKSARPKTSTWANAAIASADKFTLHFNCEVLNKIFPQNILTVGPWTEIHVREDMQCLKPGLKQLNLVCSVVLLPSDYRKYRDHPWTVMLPYLPTVQFRELEELNVRLDFSAHAGVLNDFIIDGISVKVVKEMEAQVVDFGANIGVQGVLSSKPRDVMVDGWLYTKMVHEVKLKVAKK